MSNINAIIQGQDTAYMKKWFDMLKDLPNCNFYGDEVTVSMTKEEADKFMIKLNERGEL